MTMTLTLTFDLDLEKGFNRLVMSYTTKVNIHIGVCPLPSQPELKRLVKYLLSELIYELLSELIHELISELTVS